VATAIPGRRSVCPNPPPAVLVLVFSDPYQDAAQLDFVRRAIGGGKALAGPEADICAQSRTLIEREMREDACLLVEQHSRCVARTRFRSVTSSASTCTFSATWGQLTPGAQRQADPATSLGQASRFGDYFFAGEPTISAKRKK